MSKGRHRNPDVEIKAGETSRFECGDCHTEFEITLEPKAKGDAHAQKGIEPREVMTCPFCTSGDVLPC
jgi:transposase-like protein